MTQEPRSVEEIVARINEVQPQDFFGFEIADLVGALAYDDAKPWLNEKATPENWTPAATTPAEAVAAAQDYMAFAWDKANNCRGISANRSIAHMRSWLWLAREDDLLEALDSSAYRFYGKPQLRLICTYFGWDWRALDNDEWVNNESADPRTADSVPTFGPGVKQ